MKLTTLYPVYFPSLLWWQKALAADVIIILDDQPNPRLSYLNRCWIKTTVGKSVLSVPVCKGTHNQIAIKNLKIDPTKNWYRTHKASLISNYRNSPYYEFYFPYIEELLNKEREDLD